MSFDWAGYTFHALGRHDARFIKGPGLYAFVARRRDDRTLLFIGEAECIARVVAPDHPQWADATRLGMNELHVFLRPRERIERLLVLDRITRRCGPLLNLLEPVGAAERAEAAAAAAANGGRNCA